MKKRLGNFFFIFIIFFSLKCNLSFSKEFQTNFGFYVELPENYVSWNSPNFEAILRSTENKKFGINKEIFEKIIDKLIKDSGLLSIDSIKENTEIFFPKKKYDAEYNYISIQVRRSTDFEVFLKYKPDEVCLTFKSVFSSRYKKDISLNDCKFNPSFIKKQNSPGIYYMEFEGLEKKYNVLFIILQIKGQISFFKARCLVENCTLIKKDLIEITNSRKE